MRHATLHEIAKFAAGLVAADFLWLLWFSQQHVKSASFFGITVTPETLLPSIIFDIALFIILIHYGWHIGSIPAIRERSYIFVVGCIFAFVAVAHFWRIFSGADLMLGDWAAPVWLSWFGIAVTSYLSYMSFRLAAKMK